MRKPGAKSFIALAAPSGGGKTTLCHMLLKKYPHTRLSISNTTRPPRANEQEGTHYFFITKDKFQALVDQGRLAEWALVHGNFYGTGKEFLESQKAAGHVVLLDIDIQGVKSLQKAYPEDTYAIFLQAPSFAILEERLRARKTESEDKLQERLRNARAEIAESAVCDRELVNHNLDDTFQELCAILEKEAGL